MKFLGHDEPFEEKSEIFEKEDQPKLCRNIFPRLY